METCPREGVAKERSFQTPGNPLTSGFVRSFGISEGTITGWGEPTEYTTPNGEVAQMLASATSKQGLNREAWVACLG